MNEKIDSLRIKIIKLSEDAESRGTPLGWFEELYASAKLDHDQIPWARMAPHPKMVEYIKNNPEIKGNVLVVGCGLGDDAEWLGENGFKVTAFDVSKSSINWCNERFPNSSVDYCVADLLAPPPHWKSSFDLIVEIHILQAIPKVIRSQAAIMLPKLLKSKGHLLCIGRLDEEDAIQDSGPPWPLKKIWLEKRFKDLKKINFTKFNVENNNLKRDFPDVPRYIAVWKKD